MNLDGLMLTKNKFSKMVEETVVEKNLSYMESILHICEKNNIEIEDVKKFMSNVIKDKLEFEARELNFMPKNDNLTF